MTTPRRSLVPSLVPALVPALASLLALAGCLDQPDVDTRDFEDLPAAAAAPDAVGDAAVRVEQAERALDVGRDVTTARATLAAVAADKTAPADLRDRAALSLSRALESAKDLEGAIVAVESLLAAHADDHQWPAKDAADRRLRKLLTGSEEQPASPRGPTDKASPFARVLAGYYPTAKDVPVEIAILAFGGDSSASDQLGTFHVGDAMRDIAQDACPLCDSKVDIHTRSSRSGSWTAIPGAKGQMGGALTVFYTHLGDAIPGRYDAVLPAPMAEVTAHLQKGESFVVARERPGAPPVVLIAAPREAQLIDVEEALSKMTALPTSLTVVKVPAKLKPDEIRTVMRTGMRELSKCYEELLKREPAAAGKVDVRFAIRGDGSVENAQLDTTDSFDDAGLVSCITDTTSALRFAATGVTTTVTYPIAFSPGDDEKASK